MRDFLVDSLFVCFMPLVCLYHAMTGSVFLNVAAQDGPPLEQLSNTLLAPVHYLLDGKKAVQIPDGHWIFSQRFDYTHAFWIKTAASLAALPPSAVLGYTVKAFSLLDRKARSRYQALVAAKESKEIRSNLTAYRDIGLQVSEPKGLLIPLGHQRRAGDERVFEVEKEALREIGGIFTELGIPWWLDCGSCLGAYRYGGVIPWDEDIDVAILLPDFRNVRSALNRLDPKQYIVQDWSSRDRPDSLIKVYIRQTGTLIDIYSFAIHPETQEIAFVFSLENNMFFPEWWKIRERRFKVPVAFDTVFPLKRAQFDGVEVFVPNDTKKYLQRYYGENLDPVKTYNALTGFYERDLSHPYWQTPYVH